MFTPASLSLPGKEGADYWGVGLGHGGPQNSVAERAGTGGGWSRMERPACFLGANDEELWEAVTRLLLGPDVFMAFVFTGILKQQGKRCQGCPRMDTGLPLHMDMWLLQP